MESTVRFVRVVQVALLSSIVVYAFVGELVRRNHAPNDAVFHVLSLASIVVVSIIVVVRRTLVLPSEQLLYQKPGDTLRQQRWKNAYIFLYATCEVLALLGLVLRLLGFSLSHILGFYVGGFVLLLLFSPRRPPTRDFR
jgi:archaellum biogenesis protein FlaJ (TadC family)